MNNFIIVRCAKYTWANYPIQKKITIVIDYAATIFRFVLVIPSFCTMEDQGIHYIILQGPLPSLFIFVKYSNIHRTQFLQCNRENKLTTEREDILLVGEARNGLKLLKRRNIPFGIFISFCVNMNKWHEEMKNTESHLSGTSSFCWYYWFLR